MPRNPGHIPDECRIRDAEGNVTGYRRVHVLLFNGRTTKGSRPAGWASGGNGGCNWKISDPPHPFDIRQYEVI